MASRWRRASRSMSVAETRHPASPGGAAVKDASGKFVHEAVWRYLFTHPVEQTGQSVPRDPSCRKDLRPVKTDK